MYMQFDENAMYLNGALSEKARHAGYAVAGYGSTQVATANGKTAPALPAGIVYPLIKVGATDAKVEKNTGIKGLIKWLNGAIYEALFQAGLHTTDYEPLDDDTKYDATAAKNVEKYQTLKGLKVDGEVGKQTWKALGYTGVNNSTGKVYTPSKKPSSVKDEEEGKVNPYEQWYEKTWVQVTGGVALLSLAAYLIYPMIRK